MPQLFDSSNKDHPMVPDSMLVGNMDKLTAYHPHSDDPRFVGLKNQTNQCLLRFIQFARCARELGEEDAHCKYQFYRAQCVCPGFALDDLMDERARGVSYLDQLPDRSLIHMRHPQ
jgi:cytochrome c oxidase subunit 6b